MPDTRRIEREIRQVLADKTANVHVEVLGDDLCHLRGRLSGPSDTPYAGGTFFVDIVLPGNYPFAPPKMKFETRIYHPNISSVTGAICLDILKDEWSPVLTLKTVLISLQSLLCDAAPDNPQDAEVAKRYISDRAGFDRTATDWTKQYAITETHAPSQPPSHPTPPPNPKPEKQPPPPPEEVGLDRAAIARMTEMGFPRALVVRALRQSDGNEVRALEAVLADNVL
ncbi:ubiquitin-conjugating enzyme/RWD-like protein [Fimicolochytrium jonesii]|uniref:ubiquitin-conjugating enzyme/RWD-like protein n=1 Tax=Fimicolochytrium jonesii TaxID=1396493 RepID=UPI0022FF06B3|nr:ubiquitin-conjugating enzyme/RWD-like protein [Fimicolochytrium jonesii]KAI8826264.1 ubiquitin-conjugating enzyme/RWD-like protein [Fimicolochytrium jonesii]